MNILKQAIDYAAKSHADLLRHHDDVPEDAAQRLQDEYQRIATELLAAIATDPTKKVYRGIGNPPAAAGEVLAEAIDFLPGDPSAPAFTTLIVLAALGADVKNKAFALLIQAVEVHAESGADQLLDKMHADIGKEEDRRNEPPDPTEEQVVGWNRMMGYGVVP